MPFIQENLNMSSATMPSDTRDHIITELSHITGSLSILKYKFRHSDFELPTWLRVPPEVRDAIHSLEKKAIVTIGHMQRLMLRRGDRFNFLCSRDDELIFHQHLHSMELLLGWKKDWNFQDPTLAISAKVPRQALTISIDENAYATVAHQYTNMVTAYLEGPFYKWCHSRDKVLHLAHQLMCNPRSLKYNNPLEFTEFSKWYQGAFGAAMFDWESCLVGLILPDFEVTVMDLQAMILERVDSSTMLEGGLFISPL
jgi:hypothetical protein